MQIIKWKEIFEVIETAVDKCEDISNIIESVILKRLKSCGSIHSRCHHNDILTLAFEFSDGWHDAANSIATVVFFPRPDTISRHALGRILRILSLRSYLNSRRRRNHRVRVSSILKMVNEKVLLAGLLGAITWNLITLTLGLPP